MRKIIARCDSMFHSSPGLSDLSSACASDLDRVWYCFTYSTYQRNSSPTDTAPRVRYAWWILLL